MNKISVFLLLSCLVINSSCALLQSGRRRGFTQRKAPRKSFSGIRKKIALLGFFNEAPYGGKDLSFIANLELGKELSRTSEFVVDPMAKKIFGSSKEIYAGGGVKLVQLSRKAKIHGVNFVMYGRIIEARIREKTDEIGFVRKTKSYTESKVEIRIFDVSSNKEIYSEISEGYADDSSFRIIGANRDDHLLFRQELLRYGVKVAVRKVIPKVVDLASRLDWTGRVAKIIGNKIYVNAGRLSGVNIGDILKVITEGAEIYDPETGALLGVSKGETKGTIEIIDYFGSDGTIAVLHSGGSVLEGDFVQLY